MKQYKKIKNYQDLIVWQQAHQLVLEIYRITNNFPQAELFSLTNQIRRAAISITSNIAEGFSRQSPKEKSQFYYLSLGSLTELDNQLTLAKDLAYLQPDQSTRISSQIVSVHKLLNRLITVTKSKI